MSNQLSESDAARRSGVRLPVWAWFTLWMVVWVGIPMVAHYAIHGVVNGWQFTLAFFLAINLNICIWEICLVVRNRDITYWNTDPAGRAVRPPAGIFLQRKSLREMATTQPWAQIWSEYVYYDPSYADPRSYGFWGDTGNGFSTLLPSIFFLVGMTVPMVSPAVLGIVGVMMFWQKAYCTSVYLVTYLFHRRWVGRPLGWVMLAVGGSNGIWIVFPLIGLYACIRLILENRFDLFWS